MSCWKKQNKYGEKCYAIIFIDRLSKCKNHICVARTWYWWGKKTKGRKRHIVTDTIGHLLYVRIHAANIHDTISGGNVFKGALAKYPTIKGCCADAGYRKTFENDVLSLGKTVKISEKIKPKGWAVLPQRWVVERTFS